jgi:hypothetical protein
MTLVPDKLGTPAAALGLRDLEPGAGITDRQVALLRLVVSGHATEAKV